MFLPGIMCVDDKAVEQAKMQPGTCYEHLILAECALHQACEKGDVSLTSDSDAAQLSKEVLPDALHAHYLWICFGTM